ncbi:response regulator containing a CheY-like receiver domain and an HD-GYP domain protein [Rheinheimera sp. A13L]|uniref:HD domain-containing phosphohydrolase n=1 Tax=Rheinheimera sp. A13L TaxID=506534 RepID=UPI0002124E84|nr:HD domain-containing phosphohydrolase [Rheinheimera sp. A13L]EGM78582.1 response regulator containing a CheY-like receiver domain and an HD-GYP domain protein [Rheinheimera sp. A13L]
MNADERPVAALEMSAAVLCVDDDTSTLNALQRLLMAAGLGVVTATNGKQALALMEKQDFAVILTDMRMPGMTGAEFLRLAAQRAPESQRLVLTGYADLDSTINAINQGQIQRYVQKPWNNDELLLLLRDSVEKYQLLRQNRELQRKLALQNNSLKALNHQLEQHVSKRTAQLRQVLKQLEHEHQSLLDLLFNFISVNPHLNGHFAQHVARTCHLLCSHLELDEKEQQQIVMAGLLSQIGLLGMEPTLYRKAFFELDGTERQQYVTHPAMAQLMLLPASHLAVMSDAIYHQYERYNGSGSPDHLVGTDIPLGARIVALARDFWLMIERQGAQQDNAYAAALQQLKMQQGSSYDPVLLNILSALPCDELFGSELIASSHLQLSTDELEVGMLLERPLYNENRILLLPHGHVFSLSSVAKLRQIERNRQKKWTLLVSSAKVSLE